MRKFQTGQIALALCLIPLALPLIGSAKPAPPSATRTVGLGEWRDIEGKSYSLKDLQSQKATVFFFASTECPIANLYTPRMAELAKAYASQGTQFFLVNPNREDTPAKLKRYVKERNLPFPAVKDDNLLLADALAATRTPEAILLDAEGIVRYRGRIDDNVDRAKVIRNDLKSALDAVLAGKPVKYGKMLAFGCEIFRDTSKPQATIKTAVTYAKEVAPILFNACVSCHRPGESGPFSLETYQQARTWGKAIKDYTARRIMPPWKAAGGVGDFHDARVLSDTQIATLAHWVDSGMPQGDLKQVPALPKPPASGWELGKPDLVAQSDTPYMLGAEGNDVYRNFVIPVDTSVDRFVRGMEFKADNRAIVHHMIVFFDLSGKSVENDAADPAPGYSSNDFAIGVPFNKTVWVAGWAPGNSPRFLSEGMAFPLPKGAKLVLQVHYHKNGQTQYDRSKVGVHFVDESRVSKVVYTGAVTYPYLNLKPNVAKQTVTTARELGEDTEVIAVFPHMHNLGRELKLNAETPGGKVTPMIQINDWDFNWQETYVYKKSLQLPKGTKLRLFASFDNTESNPRQPSHPPVTVYWGEQTSDEMCIGFYQYAHPYRKGDATRTLLN